MAGTVVVDAVKSSTTGAPTFQNTSGTEIGTLCRAWVSFAGATGAINASFNVGSVTRNSVGNYTINFTNAMPAANYATVGMASRKTAVESDGIICLDWNTVPTTSAVRVNIINTNNTSIDTTYVSVAIFR